MPELIAFSSRAHMAARVADLIEAELARAIASDGAADIALSGGSTPGPVYEELSRRALDWPRVTASLVDERWVPPDHDASNERLARRTLLQNAAASAVFRGMYRLASGPAKAEDKVEADYPARGRAFDVVILGLGPDGHTASWFPYAEGLSRALSEKRHVVAIRTPDTPVAAGLRDRMTLSLHAIADARRILLLMSGADKREAYEKACDEGDVEEMPARAILRARSDIWVCWAP